MHFKENHPNVETDTVCNTVALSYQVLLLTVGLVYNQVAALNRTGRLQPIEYCNGTGGITLLDHPAGEKNACTRSMQIGLR